MANGVALDFWDALFGKGEIYGIKPFGLDALDLVRIAGLLVPGQDFMVAEDAIGQAQLDHHLSWVYLGWWIYLSRLMEGCLVEEKKRLNILLKLNIKEQAHMVHIFTIKPIRKSEQSLPRCFLPVRKQILHMLHCMILGIKTKTRSLPRSTIRKIWNGIG